MTFFNDENLMFITIFCGLGGLILFVPVLLIGGKNWMFYAWVPITPTITWWGILHLLEKFHSTKQEEKTI